MLIELDGVRLLTDPVLSRRIFHVRRFAPSQPAPEVDAVLISHAHYDHLDRPTLRRLPGRPTLVVPRGVRSVRATGIGPGERIAIGGVTVLATYAEHDGRRSLFPTRAPALGYVVEGSQRIYFAGDTDVFPAMAELRPLDLALLPVSGWGPRLPAGHLDPAGAARALQLLEPRAAVPIHWGTYVARGGVRGAAPAEEFRRHAAELAPSVAVHVLPVGGELEIIPTG